MNTTNLTVAIKPRKKAIYKPTPRSNFVDLPDEAFVRMKTVCALLGDCTAVTVYRLMNAGEFPHNKKLAPNMVGWNVGELRQYLKSL